MNAGGQVCGFWVKNIERQKNPSIAPYLVTTLLLGFATYLGTFLPKTRNKNIINKFWASINTFSP